MKCFFSLLFSNRAVNKRFSRLESHVVTLARSVAHLSSELRSQASISQDMDDMRRQVNAQQYKPEEVSDPAKESAMLQSRVKKLRRCILTIEFDLRLLRGRYLGTSRIPLKSCRCVTSRKNV